MFKAGVSWATMTSWYVVGLVLGRGGAAVPSYIRVNNWAEEAGLCQWTLQLQSLILKAFAVVIFVLVFSF